MKFFYFVGGLAGGVLAGMGMGGGTLTIPILTLGLHADQLSAQLVNLLAFLPTGAVALMLHIKNGLVERKGLFLVLIPSIIGAAAASFFALKTDTEMLRKLFGGFLVAVSVFCFSLQLYTANKKA